MSDAGPLLAALADAESALTRGDPTAALEALSEATRACAALRAARASLTPDELGRARALHALGADIAAIARARLAREVERAGSARRAALAYAR
jgi:hypothetical protein